MTTRHDTAAERAVPTAWRWPDAWTLIGLLVLAAALRLPDLATRGTWDGDQGHDMLVLSAWVRDGILPLLGPPTSLGDVHHGAWYYYLLAPAAFPTGAQSPLAVAVLIALTGIAAVGVVWWLGRAVAGPIAGLVAGLAMAVSAAAIDESTFIWNPNLIALSSSVALAAAWRAWTGGRAGWWVVAAIGTALTMQCHVLGIALLPIVAAAFVADARRRPLGRVLVACVGVFAVAYAPLVVHELTTDFSELRAAFDYVAGGRDAAASALPIRVWIVGLRLVGWPLAGLITDGLPATVVATAAVAVVVVAGWRGPWSPAVRWLGLGLLWSTLSLAVAAPSLATVVPGLPNDHYHAFADPMVFLLVGIGAAGAVRGGTRRPLALVAAIAIVALVGWNVTRLPPAVHPDRGWPAGRAAGDRADMALTVAGVEATSIVLLRSLPEFKSTEAMAYPLLLRGRPFVAETPDGPAPGSVDPPVPAATGGSSPAGYGGLVLLCDDRFSTAIGARCGGPAESGVTPDGGGTAWGPLLDRFEAAPGRFVSVYGPPVRFVSGS